jgi:hypothetical protein
MKHVKGGARYKSFGTSALNALIALLFQWLLLLSNSDTNPLFNPDYVVGTTMFNIE